MNSGRRSRVTIALLFTILLVSVALNAVLFAQGRRYYLELNDVRLDPLGLSNFAFDADHSRPAGNERKVVVFFGDSRAADWPAPVAFAHLVFFNRGIGAQTSSQALLRFDEHVAPLQPQVVIVQVGVNDLKTVALFPDRRESIIAVCKDNIRQIVGRSADLGATVILTTIFPVGEAPLARQLFWSPDVAAAVEEVNASMRLLAAPDVVVLDAYAILVNTGDGLIQPQYALDELHLNAAGYDALNSALASILAGLD